MTPWKYESAEDLDQGVIERLRRFPREPDMFVYGMRSAAALTLRAWLRLFHRFKISGREHLPRGRSCVLVANHSSHLDTLCLLSALPLRSLHRAFPGAAADYFFESVPRIWVAAVVVNALPFSRQVNIRQSLGLCQQLLANPGNVLLLFPEGTRSIDEKVGKFKPGIGMLLAGQDIPVLPCFLSGAAKAWPKGRALPVPAKVTLKIGSPRTYQGLTPGRESAVAIAEELEAVVRGMQSGD